MSQNEKIVVTGQCNETSWYRIEYLDEIAYVSNNYVQNEPVEEKNNLASTNQSVGNPLVLQKVSIIMSMPEDVYMEFPADVTKDEMLEISRASRPSDSAGYYSNGTIEMTFCGAAIWDMYDPKTTLNGFAYTANKLVAYQTGTQLTFFLTDKNRVLYIDNNDSRRILKGEWSLEQDWFVEFMVEQGCSKDGWIYY